MGSAYSLFVPLSPIRTNTAGFGSCAELNGARDVTITRRLKPEGARNMANENRRLIGCLCLGCTASLYFVPIPNECRRSRYGVEVICKPPARKVTSRCVHVGCADEQADLKGSGLWMVMSRGPKLGSPIDPRNSHVDGSAK